MTIVEQIESESTTDEREHWSPEQVDEVPTCKACGKKLVAEPEATGEMIEIGCKTKDCPEVGRILRRVPLRVEHVERLSRRPTNRGLHDRGLGTWLDETRLKKDPKFRHFFDDIVLRNNPAVDLSTDKGSIDFVARHRDLLNRIRVDAVKASLNESPIDRWRDASVYFTDWVFGIDYFIGFACTIPEADPDPELAIQRAIVRTRRFVQDYLEEFNERRPLGTLLSVERWGLFCEQVSAIVVETIETDGPQPPNIIRTIIDGCLEIAGLVEKIFLCPVCSEKKMKVKMADENGAVSAPQKKATVRCHACGFTVKIDVPRDALMDDTYKSFLSNPSVAVMIAHSKVLRRGKK